MLVHQRVNGFSGTQKVEVKLTDSSQILAQKISDWTCWQGSPSVPEPYRSSCEYPRFIGWGPHLSKMWYHLQSNLRTSKFRLSCNMLIRPQSYLLYYYIDPFVMKRGTGKVTIYKWCPWTDFDISCLNICKPFKPAKKKMWLPSGELT